MTAPHAQPLTSLDEWEDDLKTRYPEADKPAFKATDSEKKKEEFRNYDNPQRDTVREFYRLNHKYQTYDFVMQKREEFLSFSKREMPVWEAFNFLNELVDDSDSDTDLD
jgi:inositol oxygenase